LIEYKTVSATTENISVSQLENLLTHLLTAPDPHGATTIKCYF